MIKIVLTGLSALVGVAALGRAFGNRARDSRGPKGWEAAFLDMLKADVTNIEYLVHGFHRPARRERRWESTESMEPI